ncbi:MAG: 2-octaprenylphenol hydroxylase [Xylophilus sp.]|nr:MAG: 2-octaprenylphenol hydroxylase [Xylophilus sp.]
MHDGADLDRGLRLDAARTGRDALGWIVPNHALRRAGLAAALARPNVRLIDAAPAVQAQTTDALARLDADRGALPSLRARLLAAADRRFSAVRRQLGIGAEMGDFGRTMIVARVHHRLPHGAIAHECFGHARTLAMLPLPPSPDGSHASSAVLTVDTPEAADLLGLPPAGYAAFIAREFQHQLGPFALAGERHAYPLVATWAHRFAACRAALVGDAAVGMHPVTAHGFNLGLAGVQTLAALLAQARRRGQDIGAGTLLAAYDREHQRASRLIYQGTNAVVGLFTDARPLPRLLRQAVLRGADRLPPLKAAIARHLTGTLDTPCLTPALRIS